MNIPYDSYRVFNAVVRCGSLSAAAEKLRMNQPNVSRCIRNLESSLSATLFLRGRKGVTLTERGEALYAHTKIAVEQLEQAEKEFLQDGESVRIAATETALRCFLLPVLETFRRIFPAVNLQIVNLNSTASVEAVKQGRISLAVISGPLRELQPLCSTHIREIRDVCICGECFPELWERSLTASELANYPLISLARDTVNYEIYGTWFAGCGAAYEPQVDAATLDLVLPMVRAGLGIGFVPAEFLTESGAAGVHVLKLRERLPRRELLLLEHPELRLRDAEKELKELILH